MFFQGSAWAEISRNVLSLLGEHIETVITVGGIIIGAGKTLSEHSKSLPTLISRRNEELQRVGELAGHYQHLTAAPLAPEHRDLLQQQIQERIQECVSAIRQFDQQLQEGEKDPNWRLSTWKKILLWYKPLGWREGVPHVLTYICFAAAAWFGIRAGVHWKDDGPSFLMLAFMLVAFTFVFHYWSFDGRRRELGYHKELGRISRLLLIQAPENGRMLLGQICFFLSATLSVSIVCALALDFRSFQNASEVGYAIVWVVVVSIYTSIFHGWVWAELRRPKDKHQLVSFPRALFKNFYRETRQFGWARFKFMFAFCMGLIPCLVCLFFIAYAGIFGGVFFLVFFFLGLFIILLVPVYAAFRTVRINYSLCHPKQLVVAARAS